MAITYKIDDKFGITLDVNGALVAQPTWPDGSAFASKAEAEKWAKVFIGYLEDESAPQPGNSPDKPVLKDEELVDYAARAEFEKFIAEEKERLEAFAAENAVEVEVLPPMPDSAVADEDVVDAEIVNEA